VKNAKKSIITLSLTFLLMSMVAATLPSNTVDAADSGEVLNANFGLYKGGKWWRVQTDLITILFPADGKKPMFLWWYSNDTNNIYVVKYKGLIEYLAIDYPYYQRKCQADHLTIKERLEAKYCESGLYTSWKRQQIRDNIQSMYWRWVLDFHPAYLPFSACQWNLTGPISVTRGDGVSYISFNFTMVKAHLPIFKFAENNVIIRCRFYGTDASENVHGLYNYTVHAGELKMDFIVKNWEWNIDKLTEFFNDLDEVFNITAPKMRAGIALWVDLASVGIVDMPIAEQDAGSTSDLVEANSKTSDIIMGNQRVQVRENKTAMGVDETPVYVGDRIHERCRLRFAKGSQTLAGFFDFVNKAVVVNATTEKPALVNVTAAYIPAGNHMRLFVGYPYFGNCTLEHDPSIGVESVTPWLPTNLLLLLISATIIIGIAVVVVKIRKKTVNIVNLQ
jgi:hypothetical protein